MQINLSSTEARVNDILFGNGDPGWSPDAPFNAGTKANGGGREDDIRRTAIDIQELEIVNAAELLRKPAPRRQWLVEPWLPHREVTLFSGDGGIGKSTIGLQLCVSCVAGLPWFGRDIRSGAALYLSCEDDRDEVHFRLQQIKAHEPSADLSRLHIVCLAGQDAILAKPSNGRMQGTKLFGVIETAIEKHSVRLLVLDSAADVFGGNEIDRGQTRSFIQLLRGLAIRRNCAVILLAHPSVDAMKTGRGYSGTTHWNNGVRSRLYLIRATAEDDSEPDPDLRILELAKANRGRVGQKIFMRWHEGAFVLDGMGEDGLQKLNRDLKIEQTFLELLDLYRTQDRHVSPSPSRTYAPTMFSKDPAANGIGPKAFERAMNILLTADKIKIETDGPPSKRRQHLARVANDQSAE